VQPDHQVVTDAVAGLIASTQTTPLISALSAASADRRRPDRIDARTLVLLTDDDYARSFLTPSFRAEISRCHHAHGEMTRRRDSLRFAALFDGGGTRRSFLSLVTLASVKS